MNKITIKSTRETNYGSFVDEDIIDDVDLENNLERNWLEEETNIKREDIDQDEYITNCHDVFDILIFRYKDDEIISESDDVMEDFCCYILNRFWKKSKTFVINLCCLVVCMIPTIINAICYNYYIKYQTYSRNYALGVNIFIFICNFILGVFILIYRSGCLTKERLYFMSLFGLCVFHLYVSDFIFADSYCLIGYSSILVIPLTLLFYNIIEDAVSYLKRMREEWRNKLYVKIENEKNKANKDNLDNLITDEFIE